MKRYSMQYESDLTSSNSNRHVYGFASSMKTAKGYIGKCRRERAEENPRRFMVFDHWADVDPNTDYVPCVYFEEA